jgi:inhibitor of growth protein 3
MIGDEGDDADGDAGGDDRTYCYCDRVSFGNMIGCDGEDCQREWFHLACVGMDTPPKGEWYCDDCSEKRKKDFNLNKKKR